MLLIKPCFHFYQGLKNCKKTSQESSKKRSAAMPPVESSLGLLREFSRTSQLICELQGRGKYNHKMLMQVLKMKRCMILNSRHQVSFISQFLLWLVPAKLKNLLPTLMTILLKASFLLLLSYQAHVLSFEFLALCINFDCKMNILSLDAFF